MAMATYWLITSISRMGVSSTTSTCGQIPAMRGGHLRSIGKILLQEITAVCALLWEEAGVSSTPSVARLLIVSIMGSLHGQCECLVHHPYPFIKAV